MLGAWGDPANGIELAQVCTDKLVDRIARPVSLAQDSSAYAVTIVGDSMWPRFRRGRIVAVSARLAAAAGDDVLVKLRSDAPGEPGAGAVPVLIKQLVSSNGSGVELRQFNPDLTFQVPAGDVSSIEKVLGELI
jgi:phage repressor protein C with HTH and peptisase S24 domain